MSGIFGIIQRDGAPIEAKILKKMRTSMRDWGSGGSDLWWSGCAGLGQMRTCTTPEVYLECFPRYEDNIAFTFAGRVDNRHELITDLCLLVNQKAPISDGDLVFLAYRKWGQACVERIYGDWSFAAWHPTELKLFLARDHYGNTGLYYYEDAHILAFASDRLALLALNLASWDIDELYLAQVLISWPIYHGERTIYTKIKRLPPAHTLTLAPKQLEVYQYWFLEQTPELHLKNRNDYVEAFREIFDEAVRARLRHPTTDGDNPIATTLSGGLDSGSVTATAAKLLAAERKQLAAYTSIPLYNTVNYTGKWFGDELPYARATAELAQNINLHTITAASITPIQAIRRMLKIIGEPAHAAGNFYWILDLARVLQASGCCILLTGQAGNGGVSWKGQIWSQPLSFQLQQLGWYNWAKSAAINYAPLPLIKIYQHIRQPAGMQLASSAIHPDFARRLKIWDQCLADPNQMPTSKPLAQRTRILQPGRGSFGSVWMEIGATHNLEVRDPTSDARLLAFTFSVPDHIFMDPASGLDRWLIRVAMQNRLPDIVRLNRQRGRQAGDLVPRLRASASEIDNLLNELASGPATGFVDVPYMTKVWKVVQKEDTQDAFYKSVTVLTRGLMAGLFINQLEAGK